MDANFIVPGLSDIAKPASIKRLTDMDGGMFTIFFRDVQNWRMDDLPVSDELLLVIALYCTATGIPIDIGCLPREVRMVYREKSPVMLKQIEKNIAKAKAGQKGGRNAQGRKRADRDAYKANRQANDEAKGQANFEPTTTTPTTTSTKTNTAARDALERVCAPCPPSLSEVQEFFAAEQLFSSPYDFFHYYASIGWKRGGVPIVDWRALAYLWASREKSDVHVPMPDFMAEG